MKLVERLWTGLTKILSVLTLSPFEQSNQQYPLAPTTHAISHAQPSHTTAYAQPPHPHKSPVPQNHQVPSVRPSYEDSRVKEFFENAPVDYYDAPPIEDPSYGSQDAPGPIFSPPGGDGSGFTCDYSKMNGWTQCSDLADRGCWLEDGKGGNFSIDTDYERHMPIGIDRVYNVTVGPDQINADGLIFTDAKVVNNSYPGPWIQACWGDRIYVNVTVDATFTNGTTLHWHGIRQNQTMHMDGVPGITQCPIPPGGSFLYNFTATQYGSSWYHSHYSRQYADGVLGPITIHGPSTAHYDEAAAPPLLMTDWDHISDFQAAYEDNVKPLYPTVLLNGTGNITKCYPHYNSSSATVPNITTLNFVHGTKYLLRVINAAYGSHFVFSIDNHLLTVVSADFVPIENYTTESIFVGIGQRYNVIVEANPLTNGSNPIPTDHNFWIRMFVVDNCFGDRPPGGDYTEIGIVRYDSTSTADPLSSQWPEMDTTTCEDETGWKPWYPWSIGPPINPGEVHQITPGSSSDYPLAGYAFTELEPISTPFHPMDVDYQNITFRNLDNYAGWPNSWDVVVQNGTYTDWVYLVVTSIDTAHPIHLHGHDFAILAQSGDPYDPSNLVLITENPPRRDVVLVPAGGYVVIAFRTDNPGAWLLHCHIANHAAAGLALQIMEDQSAAQKIWPTGNSSALNAAGELCKAWTAWCDSNNCQLNFDDSGI